MALRARTENSSEVGVFARITNTYAIVGLGSAENFYAAIQEELEPHGVPVVHTTIGDSKIVGRLTVGNRHGLLVPNTTTDSELQHLRNSLPESVTIRKVEERLNALGNVLVCNDYVALIHPQLDKETEEIVQDVLKVETFRVAIANNELVGSNCVLTNRGGLVHPATPVGEMQELSTLLQLPLTAGTVNRGFEGVAAGVTANDFTAVIGMDCTATEVAVIEKIFQLRNVNNLRTALVDTLAQIVDEITSPPIVDQTYKTGNVIAFVHNNFYSFDREDLRKQLYFEGDHIIADEEFFRKNKLIV